MNRELISKAIGNIDDVYIYESLQSPAYSAKYAPERTNKMAKPENKRKSIHSKRLISIVLAACLILTLSITAYAAAEVFGLLDYLERRGINKNERVEELLNISEELYTEDVTVSEDENGIIYYSGTYAKYAVLEAVCDDNTIYLVSQLKPLGDYLLIPEYVSPDDKASSLKGMESLFENHPEMTVTEYAAADGKSLIYADISIRADLEANGTPLASEDFRYEPDGTLYYYQTVENIWDSDEFMISCTGNAYTTDANSLDEIERIPFEVKIINKSKENAKSLYTSFDPRAKLETGIQINSLSIEETELGLYVIFNYSAGEALFDGIFFKLVDAAGNELPSLPGSGGSSGIDKGDGTFDCTLSYQKPETMDGLQFKIRDIWNEVNYGPYSFE